MFGQQLQLVGDRVVYYTHSFVHVLALNDTIGLRQLEAKADVLNAVEVQYLALKPLMSGLVLFAASVPQLYSGLGQHSQSVFLTSQFALHVLVAAQLGAAVVYLCGQLGAILSLIRLDNPSQ
jgi:hypothetical protein